MIKEEKELKNFIEEYKLENAQPSSAFQNKLQKNIIKNFNKPVDASNGLLKNIFRSKFILALGSLVVVLLVATSGIVFTSSDLVEKKLTDKEIISKVYANGVGSLAVAEGESGELEASNQVNNFLRVLPGSGPDKNFMDVRMEYIELNNLNTCGDESQSGLDNFVEDYGKNFDYKSYRINENSYDRMVSYKDSIEDPEFYFLVTPETTISYTRGYGAFETPNLSIENNNQEESTANTEDLQQEDIKYLGLENIEGKDYYKFELDFEYPCLDSDLKIPAKQYTYANKDTYQVQYMKEFYVVNDVEELSYFSKIDFTFEDVDFGEVSQYFEYNLPFEIKKLPSYESDPLSDQSTSYYTIIFDYMEAVNYTNYSDEGFIEYLRANKPEYVDDQELLETYKFYIESFSSYTEDFSCESELASTGLSTEEIKSICTSGTFDEGVEDTFLQFEDTMASLYGDNWDESFYQDLVTYILSNPENISTTQFINVYYPELNSYPELVETLNSLFELYSSNLNL